MGRLSVACLGAFIVACAVLNVEGDSTYTYNLKKCKADHACGKHGWHYYWCYTEDNSWDYCCRPDYPCGKHGHDIHYNYCYAGTGFTFYCNMPDDVLDVVATKEKLCTQGHYCSQHDEKFRWCYIDEAGTWDYCCSPGQICMRRPAFDSIFDEHPYKCFSGGILAACHAV